MFDKKFLRDNPIFWSRLGGEWYPPLFDPDGKPYYGNSDEENRTYQRYHRDFAAAGVHVHSIVLDRGWPGENTYDYRVADQQLQQLLEADPEGYVLPRIKLDAPWDWCRNHPEEVFVYANGKGLTAPEIAALVGTPAQDCWQYKVPEWYEKYKDFQGEEKPYLIDAQSLSSTRWLADASVAVEKLIQHLENGPYADRIAGYHLAFGHCGECMQWHMGEWIKGAAADYLHYGDFGIAHLQRFYDYGIEKYGSQEALAIAWQQPAITRDTVELPLPKLRYADGNSLQSYFRGREKDVLLRDFDDFMSNNVTDAIWHFAAVAKKHTKKPVGFFYGYFLFAMNTQYEGNAQMDRVLACPDVDFLASPTAYHFRAAGSASFEMTVTQSVNREKVYMEETDTRTYLVAQAMADAKSRDCNHTMEETRFSLWRGLCKNIVHGSGFWWMDLGRGWFDAPDIMAEIAELTKAHEILRPGEHKSAADVLVVMDDKGMEHTQCNRFFTHSFLRNFVLTTREAGVLCDMYLSSDLDKIDLSRYRLVVFGTNYTLTKEKLAGWNFRKDTTLMFFNTVGILQNGVPALANVEALTGFALAEDYDEELKCPVLKITEGNDPLLCRKTVDGRTRVMCTDPRLPRAALREIAREAGCHIYTDEDSILFGDESFLSVFAKGETHTVLHLNGKKRCKDIRTGKVYEGKDIPLRLAQNEFLILQYQ